jgi:alpha-L-fucosidase
MPYQPTWSSLKAHETPAWFLDAKFGIYFHWGIYSVPARGRNGSWYPHNMYRQKTPQYKYHVQHFGDPAKFGYKDFIPRFTAEKFDAAEWARLIRDAGAKFAGPVAEHHDGFSMWDSQVNPWNAKKMGPKRDIVGEMAKALRNEGLKFLTAFHHAENWWFFPHSKKYDTSDPAFAGLYGAAHDIDVDPSTRDWPSQQAPPAAFWDQWKAKIIEVIDKYQPDLLWFDFGLGLTHDRYKREVLAYYFNQGEGWGKEVDVIYKGHDLPPGVGVLDYELGRSDRLAYNPWITDTSVDDIGAWSYVQEAGFKPVSALVHNLADNVAKNGLMLLNFGPKASGEIPQGARDGLSGLGEWLKVNGDAIYSTTPWTTAEEGPTRLEKGGMFAERNEVQYTPKDIRYVTKENSVYAIVLGIPKDQVLLEAFLPSRVHFPPDEIVAVELIGETSPLRWEMTKKGLLVRLPEKKPCASAIVLKIVLRNSR